MPLPIVLIHRGNSDYLLFSLSQAKKMNPKCHIYLIGDTSNNHYKWVQHHNIVDYFEEAKNFSQIYKHFNTNPYEYELFCFQRWFVLKKFMMSNGIQSCFYMDSDVMLYTEIPSEKRKFSKFDMTLHHPPLFDSPSPHCMFINKAEALFDFCDFVNQIYTKDYLLNIMKLQFENCAMTGGGACDMTAFREYQKIKGNCIGNTATILDNCLYDHNISESNGFKIHNNIKHIYWFNGKPYGKFIESSEYIQFKILHFQGDKKPLMKDYCLDKLVVIKYYLLRLIRKYKKLFNI